MLIILVFLGLTVVFLVSLVIFLSIKLQTYKRKLDSNENIEKCQLICSANKYLPRIPNKDISIPVGLQTGTKLRSDYELSSNRTKINGSEYPLNSGQVYHQRELVSAQIVNQMESSLSRSETDLTSNTNGSDNEISMLDINNEVPGIDFKLVYFSQDMTLKLHISRVTNLPLQFRKNCSSYVKITLITNSEKISTFMTNVVKKSLNPEYDEDCQFVSYNFDDLKNLTIRLSVYAKRKQLSKRQLVGDLWLPLDRPDFEPDIELICSEKLSLACPRTGKRGIENTIDCELDNDNFDNVEAPLLMTGKLGYLFIQLEYQPEAERIKIIVRKGQNLYNKSFITKPEYYVIISLLNNNDAVVYKETKPASGVSPIWNQPFIFDLQSIDTNQYWFQFLVMEGKSYTRDGVIGQVLVGPNTTFTGIQHWNDIIRPDFIVSAKWHPIAGIGTHCL